MDGYAITQLIVIFAALFLVRNRPLRVEAVSIMLAAAIGSNIAQQYGHTIAPTLWFAVIDFMALCWFVLMIGDNSGKHNGWMFCVAGMFLISSTLHGVRLVTGWPPSVIYVTSLNLMGYAAIIAIVSGPLIDAWRNHASSLRYTSALRRRTAALARLADKET